MPIAIPHYKFFGGSYYYLYGQSVGHKNPAKRFICGYCVVKIPDWKTCFPIYLAAKLRQSRTLLWNKAVLSLPLVENQKKKKKLNRQFRRMLLLGKVHCNLALSKLDDAIPNRNNVFHNVDIDQKTIFTACKHAPFYQ